VGHNTSKILIIHNADRPTCKSRGVIKEVGAKIADLRKGWLNILLKVLHSHRGQVEKLVFHEYVGPRLAWGVTNEHYDTLHFVQNLIEDNIFVTAIQM
jgi:hypothetical protein